MGLFNDFTEIIHRNKKITRNRVQAWNFVLSWSDDLFYRQFRICKHDFFVICDKIKANYPGPFLTGIENYNYAQRKGRNSNPFSGPIFMELKLAVTLRLVAGASELDMVWYGVQIQSVPFIFHFILEQINIVLPDDEIFNFNPEFAPVHFREVLDRMAYEWSSIMTRKKGHDLYKGTILATDGLIIEITAVEERDRHGLPLAAFRNRKGCWAVNAQAMCDAYTRFRYFEVSWPGSTNDITAYKQTKLYQWFLDKKIPDIFHLVMDEVFSNLILLSCVTYSTCFISVSGIWFHRWQSALDTVYAPSAKKDSRAKRREVLHDEVL